MSGIISSKVSLHIGKHFSTKHNLRTYDQSKWNKDGHIDHKLSDKNVILLHRESKDFFDEVFGDALIKYDLKNES